MKMTAKVKLPRCIALPGIVGLTLHGGLARGYADHLSEIDVTDYCAPYGVSLPGIAAKVADSGGRLHGFDGSLLL